MFAKKERKPALSRKDQKKIKAAIERNRKNSHRPDSAQKTVPYQLMFPDGLCCLTDKTYSRTIQFLDINYRLVQDEDKAEIFNGWCSFLNHFDSSVHFQLSFYNLKQAPDDDNMVVEIPNQNDAFDAICREYNTMLQNQLAKGNYGIRRTKYLTFSIEADSIRQARQRLERIEMDLLANFRELGVPAFTLDGKARLRLLHSLYHTDSNQPFRFDWNWLPQSGLSTKDLIAPSSFEFKESRTCRIGTTFCSVSFLQILAPELTDDILLDFLVMDNSLAVNMHIQSIDQTAAIRLLKRKITDLDKMKIGEQKKAVRSGYDMDILPSDLTTYGSEAKRLLQDLQSHNERIVCWKCHTHADRTQTCQGQLRTGCEH